MSWESRHLAVFFMTVMNVGGSYLCSCDRPNCSLQDSLVRHILCSAPPPKGASEFGKLEHKARLKIGQQGVVCRGVLPPPPKKNRTHEQAR